METTPWILRVHYSEFSCETNSFPIVGMFRSNLDAFAACKERWSLDPDMWVPLDEDEEDFYEIENISFPNTKGSFSFRLAAVPWGLREAEEISLGGRILTLLDSSFKLMKIH